MGAKKFNEKLVSMKVATICSVAFSAYTKKIRKYAKVFQEHENYDEFMNLVYHDTKRVICYYNLQREFYPLDSLDYVSNTDVYFLERFDLIHCAIKCIHPLMRNLHKLDINKVHQLVKTMVAHVCALIFTDLGVKPL